MPTISLNTPDSSLLAFLLIAGSDSMHEGCSLRECIITCPPQYSNNTDHPISVIRTEYLHVEHKANVHVLKDRLDIAIAIPGGAHLDITLHGNDKGAWRLRGCFGDSEGISQLIQKKQVNQTDEA